jgi:hypothetical protein
MFNFIFGVIIILFIWSVIRAVKEKKQGETKCTCKSCGNVWYYDAKEEREIRADRIGKIGRDMLRVGEGLQGNTLPWLIPENQKKDIINKCPKCNSSAIQKEKHQI